MWNDGVPLTARDIAYTYNRILARQQRVGHLGLVPVLGHQDHRSRRHDGGAQAEQAQRGAPPAADADHPRAHLEERQRERRQDLLQRARQHEPAGRRLRAVRADPGQGRRVVVPLRPQPALLGRRAQGRRGRHAGLPLRGHPRAGAVGWRDRLRRGPHPAADPAAADRPEHHRPGGRLAGLRRDRLQHRLGQPQDRQAAWAAPTRPCSTPSSASPSTTRSTGNSW